MPTHSSGDLWDIVCMKSGNVIHETRDRVEAARWLHEIAERDEDVIMTHYKADNTIEEWWPADGA